MRNKFNRNRFVQGRGRKVALRDGQYTIFFDEDTGFWMTDMGNGPITLQEAFGIADINNLTAVTAPAVTDDENDGYQVGSLWFDLVAKEAYRCMDATAGAAVWIVTTLSAAEAEAISAAYVKGPSPYNAGNVTGDITLNNSNGWIQKLTLTGATVARELNPPINGAQGNWLTHRITSAAGVDRTLAFDAAIKIPSLSGLVQPIALTQGETYVAKLYHNGTAWELVSFIGGYA